VLERTREIGLLRAVGGSRRQVRRMVRYEGVITTLIGATLGLGLGVFLAGLTTAAIDGATFSVPTGQLAVMAIIAGCARRDRSRRPGAARDAARRGGRARIRVTRGDRGPARVARA
jgi:putative ABC transport system permease protein